MKLSRAIFLILTVFFIVLPHSSKATWNIQIDNESEFSLGNEFITVNKALTPNTESNVVTTEEWADWTDLENWNQALILNGDFTLTNFSSAIYPWWGAEERFPQYFPSPIFTIEYGLDNLTNPWVQVQPEMQTNTWFDTQPPPYTFKFVCLTNSNTNLTFQITTAGGGMGSIWTYTVTNLTDNPNGAEDLSYYDEPIETTNITNSAGDLLSLWIPPTNTYTVVILRATNLDDPVWQPIFTNSIGLLSAESFTDTNIYLPTKETFYNTDTNGGSGGVTPTGGSTNAASTNGVYYIPGPAYYLIECNPTNQP